MPLRAKWGVCATHQVDEPFQYVCTYCGRYGCSSHWGICTVCVTKDECEHDNEGASKAWLCGRERARLQRRWRAIVWPT